LARAARCFALEGRARAFDPEGAAPFARRFAVAFAFACFFAPVFGAPLRLADRALAFFAVALALGFAFAFAFACFFARDLDAEVERAFARPA
jgi:heme O synthase-like polyprenyltransferase